MNADDRETLRRFWRLSQRRETRIWVAAEMQNAVADVLGVSTRFDVEGVLYG